MFVCHVSQHKRWDAQQSSLSILAHLRKRFDGNLLSIFGKRGYFSAVFSKRGWFRFFQAIKGLLLGSECSHGKMKSPDSHWEQRKCEGNKKDSRERERVTGSRSHPTQRSLMIVNISLCSHWITLYGFTRDVAHSRSLHQDSDYSLYLKQ